MAPLTAVGGKKANIHSGFDDFDDLLAAPTTKNTKKSKSKSKKTKKKSSQRKSFDSDQSYDLDEPDSPGGALSPHYSMERDDFLKMDLPRGVGDGDLDDSILGGLMGGPPKPIKSTARSDSKPAEVSKDRGFEGNSLQWTWILSHGLFLL
jgi:hypothetical protein